MRAIKVAAIIAGLTFVLTMSGSVVPLDAQNNYASSIVGNAVDVLNGRLRSGAARLTFESPAGYLRSTLDALAVPIESQMLVFSQSSLQARLINPTNPRAIYFNDSIQVGFVRGGELLELAVQDPGRGVLFYTLDQRVNGVPQFKETTICLSCHKNQDTLGMPGLITLHTRETAEVRLFATGTVPDHRTPWEERWGGWYVTGSIGPAKHGGNRVPAVNTRPTRELTTVDGLFDTSGYPSTHSDVAALMVFLHQTRMTNLIARIAWDARDAQAQERTTLVPVAERMRDITTQFVDYLLFVDEVRLTGGINSLSGFVEKFSTEGPQDTKGRSLHQLDLTRRLMRYPCSYLIYSPAFDALPPIAKDAIYERLWAILSGREKARRYTTALPLVDRRAIVEILRDTKQELPAYFDPSKVL